MKASFSG